MTAWPQPIGERDVDAKVGNALDIIEAEFKVAVIEAIDRLNDLAKTTPAAAARPIHRRLSELHALAEVLGKGIESRESNRHGW